MLTQICQYLRNWFVRESIVGSFVVAGGEISFADGTALPLLPEQYYRVIGSVFNDGVKQYEVDTLHDEPTFTGAVWSMAVPPDFIELVAEIEKWCGDNAQALSSPYASESFGGYSYSLRSGGGSSGAGDGALSWQGQFSARLGPWRKI